LTKKFTFRLRRLATCIQCKRPLSLTADWSSATHCAAFVSFSYSKPNGSIDFQVSLVSENGQTHMNVTVGGLVSKLANLCTHEVDASTVLQFKMCWVSWVVLQAYNL